MELGALLDAGLLGDDRPFLVMERLEGETLGTLLERRGRLPVGEISTGIDTCWPITSSVMSRVKAYVVRAVTLITSRSSVP
mgnify:CR=1 FL=1